ncbi:hypothetical protein LBMAG42_13450 [Deltaproteobacteria bacterium]|nr:hypothetical protein LBMAG42_13450 [Deltaproteobacteria bacterium]
MTLLRSAAVAFFLAACAGGPDVEALQAGVDAAIAAKDYPGAVAKADEALKIEKILADPAKAWRFESGRVNALAAGGKGADVLSSLERLATPYSAQVTASLYLSLADKLRAAGDGAGYTNLLDAGKKKFPDEVAFQSKLDELKTSADPAEVERLKALGYL